MRSLFQNKLIKLPLRNYKLPHRISEIFFLLIKKLKLENFFFKKYDLVFIVLEHGKGWILEAICKEIASYFPGRYCFHFLPYNLPPSNAYFFAHYSFFAVCLQLNPSLRHSQSLVWYTHPKGMMSDEELIRVLSQSTKVVSACSMHARLLVKCGLSAEKVTSVLGAADPDLFQPHHRSNGAIGFCTAYYQRKEPQRVLDIIRQLSHRKFILIGKNWHRYEKFSEMIALPNFLYFEIPYTDYPNYYKQMDVFVSPSRLEGGPIPLVETMMCNVFPVASNTGFAPDLITHGNNGFLFDVDAPIETICEFIEQAFEIKTDVRKTVEHLSWENFSMQIQHLLQSSAL